MKIRLTKSFLYSLLLHGTIVLLVIALYLASQPEKNVAGEKRCKVMLTQVCECLPEKRVVKPPVVEKQTKPQSKKKQVKKEAVPVVKEEFVVQKLSEVVDEVTEEEVALTSETVENEAVVDTEAKELIVTPEVPVVLSPAAQQPIDAPPAEEMTPEDAYIKAHISEIMALLRKNLYYPRMARKRGIEGKVLVRFELLQNGEIRNIEVVESERDILARAAVTTIERLEGKFPLPDETLVLNVPIMYQLN